MNKCKYCQKDLNDLTEYNANLHVNSCSKRRDEPSKFKINIFKNFLTKNNDNSSNKLNDNQKEIRNNPINIINNDDEYVINNDEDINDISNNLNNVTINAVDENNKINSATKSTTSSKQKKRTREEVSLINNSIIFEKCKGYQIDNISNYDIYSKFPFQLLNNLDFIFENGNIYI